MPPALSAESLAGEDPAGGYDLLLYAAAPHRRMTDHPGLPVGWTSYDRVPEWITGMGIATTFPVD
jgi:hypothetical protein